MAAKFGEPTVADDIFTPSIRNTVWFELEPRMKSDTGPPGPEFVDLHLFLQHRLPVIILDFQFDGINSEIGQFRVCGDTVSAINGQFR